MALHNPEILASMTNYFNGGGTGPVVKPADLIKIDDIRKINPATGKPFNNVGQKTLAVNPDTLRAIIAHAKLKGIDPYTALAIAYQETEFGKRDPNLGSAWSYSPDKGIPESDTLNTEASRLTNALKEKIAYAKQLGFDKKGEDFALQAYNGYGKLKPNTMVGGKYIPMNYYGITVTGDNPLDMSVNPAYGKTVVSLRDEILKKHPGIKMLVDETPAYGVSVAIK